MRCHSQALHRCRRRRRCSTTIASSSSMALSLSTFRLSYALLHQQASVMIQVCDFEQKKEFREKSALKHKSRCETKQKQIPWKNRYTRHSYAAVATKLFGSSCCI